MSGSVEAGITTAREQLAAGDPQSAFRTLSPSLGYPAPELVDRALFCSAFALFSEIARAIAGDGFADLLAAIAADPDDPQALFDAGYQSYEHKLFSIAATLFARANQLAPRQPAILEELASSLEGMMAHREAAQILDAAGLHIEQPMLAYLSGFNWLMAGELEIPRERLVQLEKFTDEPIPFVRDALAGMLARADRLLEVGIPLDDRALTAWHAVINGSLLTHESPHGHDTPMRGRYAYVSDSPGLMREGVERLVALLEIAPRPLMRVLSAPDRASQILARALARSLSLPFVVWDGDPKGIVVTWSLDAVEDSSFLTAMRHHLPDQILFAHTSSWTDPFPYAPDITTLLHQHVTHPYTGGALEMREDHVVRASADERTDDVLAAEILAAEMTNPSVSSLDSMLAIARALAVLPEQHRPGLARTTGPRTRQRAGSPVPSNRFL